MKLEKGMIIEKNGITIWIHSIKKKQVFFQKWPKGIEWQGGFDNLFRMDIDKFKAQAIRYENKS